MKAYLSENASRGLAQSKPVWTPTLSPVVLQLINNATHIVPLRIESFAGMVTCLRSTPAQIPPSMVVEQMYMNGIQKLLRDDGSSVLFTRQIIAPKPIKFTLEDGSQGFHSDAGP